MSGSSLSAEVDGMLQAVVASALCAPTPPGKRKQAFEAEGQAMESRQEQEQRCPSVEAEPTDADVPALKKPKVEGPLVCPLAVAAAPTTAFTAAAPAPVPAPPACPPPAVDLEAAVGELMGAAEELLPNTQPAESTPCASPATAADMEPAALAGAAPMLPAGAAAEPSDEPTETAAHEPAGIDDLQAMSATSGYNMSADVSEPAAAAAPAGAAPMSGDVSAAVVSASPAAHHSAPPPAAHHSALPTTQPTELLACPAASAAASGAVAATCCLPAADISSRLVRRSAPDATPEAVPTTTQPASPATSHINMLKGDVDQDMKEPPCSKELGSGSGGSCEADGGWTSSSGEAGSSQHSSAQAAASRRGRAPEQLADYRLAPKDAVGTGGLGSVYEAVHQPSGRAVAVKLGSSFIKEEGPKDFTWSTFMTEWNTYAQLAAAAPSTDASSSSRLPWLAEPFEFGLWEDGKGSVAPWFSMSLLGPSMHTLNQKHRQAVMEHLGGYALGMLDALEGLHRQGLIHNDVKPANFVTPHGFNPSQPPSKAGAAVQPQVPQIFLIDFGFTLRWDPHRAGHARDFVGTPDFAASGVLGSARPGLRDDLEALGYTLLELALGELPWDVTKHPHPDSKGHTREVSTWDAPALAGMLSRRNRAWVSAAESGRVPGWLVEWIEYCKALAPSATPDYDRLRALIAQGEREAAAAAKAAEARARSDAWLGLGAEE